MTLEEKKVLENKYLTLSECSNTLKDKYGIKISTQTLRTRIKEEKLKAYMFTNEFLVKPSDLEAYKESVALFTPEKDTKKKKRDVKNNVKRKAKRVVKSVKKPAKKGR